MRLSDHSASGGTIVKTFDSRSILRNIGDINKLEAYIASNVSHILIEYAISETKNGITKQSEGSRNSHNRKFGR